jgi:tetratricopeptide (TPR) repeat protein
VVRGYGKIKTGHVDEGVGELKEGLAWFESSQMRWTQVIGAAWLAEGYLRQGNYTSARTLVAELLATSQRSGYRHYEGRACWLMSEYLAVKGCPSAEEYVETAIRILESVGAKSDLAKAMITWAALRQRAGDTATARRLLEQAAAISQTLGTLDELARTAAVLATLDRGSLIPLLPGEP